MAFSLGKSALSRRDTDMTGGSIVRHLLLFAVPLFIGNVFQQLYNTVDSVVVGNFVGKTALAAVGSVTPIINMLIGLFSGLASGAGVIISQHYGAHDRKRLRQAVQTFFALTLVLCVVLTAVGILMTPFMLRMMKTPDDVFEGAASYLRIYFAGLSGLLIYNTGAGILRAVGDSTRPLYFLIFSAVTNTVLDLVFVAGLGWGVRGVAIATIIAQGLSALLVVAVLCRSRAEYRLDLKQLRMDGPMLRHILAIGLPSALQMSITAFSNVFVQSYVNLFESDAMAGWASYLKIDAFVRMPIMSMGMALTTFVGQNLGACNKDRARQGTRSAMLLGMAIAMSLAALQFIFAPQLIRLFNRESEVIRYGTTIMRTISPFYFAVVVNQLLMGALRGSGRTKTPMFIMLGSFVVLRQIYLAVFYNLTGSFTAVVLGYPVGWMLCSVLLTLYYRRVSREMDDPRPKE